MTAQLYVDFSEVVHFVNGDRGSNYPDRDAQADAGHCLFLNTTNVRQGFFDFSETAFIDEDRHRALGGGVLRRNDIVLTIRGTLGNTAIYDADVPFEVVRINSAMLIVRPKVGFEPSFIEHYLRSSQFTDWVGANQRGSAQPHLRTADIETAQIPLVSPAEQRRIVAKLDTLIDRLTRARAELERVEQLSERFRAAAVAAAFKGLLTREWRKALPHSSALSDADLDRRYTEVAGRKRCKPIVDIDWRPEFSLPDGWRWASIDTIVAAADYGTSAKTFDADDATPILRMGNLQGGEIDWTNLKWLPNDHPDLEGLTVQSGDVLFNRTNSYELVGKTALFRGYDRPVSFASYLIRLRPCGISPILLVRYLNSAFARQWIERVASQQVGQANVNGSKLKALGIPLPPPDEQDEMVRWLDAAFARADRLEAEAARARTLLDRLEAAILAKAFRGELVPQDPADEPASVLLDRIRAERAAAPKPKRGRRAQAPRVEP